MKAWQIESMYYFGRHEQRIPAYDAHPYPIIRAIPVEGTVGPSWMQSPQVKFWLGEPKKTLWERFLAWLDKGKRPLKVGALQNGRWCNNTNTV